MYVLGIDVGTGGTRALIIDQQGRTRASAVAEHPPFSVPQPGWAEQDPEDWWRACREAIRNALRSSNTRPEEISAIGLSGQMHGAVFLDSENRSLRPAILWCDVRTDAQCRYLEERIGRDCIVQLTCNAALPNFTLTKLLWVREDSPQLWSKVRHILLPKDYVRLRLTGEFATDATDASGTLMLDVANRAWSAPMLEAAQIDPAILPKVFESTEVTGTISAQAAEETGLRKGTPVVAGAGDQAAGATGVCVVRPGSVSATIGTSGVVFASTDQPLLDPKGRLHTFCHVMKNRWHVMGVTQAAGLSLRWFRDTFGANAAAGQDPYDVLTAEAAPIPPGAEGLLWAPYLMGERTPHLDPNATGALVGVRVTHKRGHIIRAILEGVAFSLRDTLTIFRELAIPYDAIRLGGAGASSPLWRQIQADVYGKNVLIPAAKEGAGYGAAILAGVAAGWWPSVDQACDALDSLSASTAPNPAASRVMEKQYELYRRVYPALRNIFESR
jgi:xylulokinase